MKKIIILTLLFASVQSFAQNDFKGVNIFRDTVKTPNIIQRVIDTTNLKVEVVDALGNHYKMYWPTGGGSTPTLAQVAAAGSTLTANIDVNLTGSYEWKFGNATKFRVDLTSNGTDATADLFYRGSDGYFKRLAIGSSNQVLTVSGGLPSWQTPSASTSQVQNLSSQSTNVGNVGTGEDDLMTYTLPANTLVNNNDWIDFEASYLFASNTNSKAVKFYLGTAIITLPANTHAAGGAVLLKGTVTRTSSTTCRIVYSWDPLNGTGVPAGVLDGSSMDYTTSIIIKSTADVTSGSDNDVIQKTFKAVYHAYTP